LQRFIKITYAKSRDKELETETVIFRDQDETFETEAHKKTGLETKTKPRDSIPDAYVDKHQRFCCNLLINIFQKLLHLILEKRRGLHYNKTIEPCSSLYSSHQQVASRLR